MYFRLLSFLLALNWSFMKLAYVPSLKRLAPEDILAITGSWIVSLFFVLVRSTSSSAEYIVNFPPYLIFAKQLPSISRKIIDKLQFRVFASIRVHSEQLGKTRKFSILYRPTIDLVSNLLSQLPETSQCQLSAFSLTTIAIFTKISFFLL